MKNATLKRLSTVLLAFMVMMAMGMSCMTTFAATVDEADTLTVSGVEAGATVTAYQIVKEVAGVWTPVTAGSIADCTNPTAAEIAALAAAPPTTNTFNLTYDSTNGVYSASGKDAGLYLILVTGSGATVYNPMIVAVDYDSELDDVSASDFFVYKDTNAYAKSTTPTVDKSNDNEGKTDNNGGTTDNGTSAQTGETVGFTIETTIPSYSPQYQTVKFDVTDKMDAGLTPPDGTDEGGKVKVTVGGTEVAPSTDTDKTYTVTYGEDGFVVSFDPTYIKSLANTTEAARKVVITYNATVNDSATYNFDPNNNKATIEFTNNPSGSTGTKTDESKIYTFGLDANLSGTTTTGNEKTHEIIKVDENGNATTQSFTKDTNESTVTNALSGAVFSLKGVDGTDTAGFSKTATTSSNGYLQFTGLREGTYTLKEETAPAGYKPDPNPHTVVIDALYNENGTLASYSVTIDGEATSTYSATYSDTGMTLTETSAETTYIVNDKIPALPSTGGMGTHLFIVLGALIMTFAAIALTRRNKSAKEAR